MNARSALVLALLAFAAPAVADELADGVAAIAPGVEDARIAGTWTDTSGNGVYRVVIARQSSQGSPARLFVQWIARAEDGTATVAHSIEIAEVAEANLGITSYHAESEADGLSVFLDATDPAGDSQTYELFVTSPEEYRFSAATN